MNTLLEGRSLGRRLSEESWLFQKLSIQVRAGDAVALVGPTGVGKSLLLRALVLLDPLDEGEVLWRGEPVTSQHIPEFRGQVIYLHQRASFLPGSVEENLRWPFTLRTHHDRQFDHSAILRALQEAGQDEGFLSQEASTLSGGQRQMVALLRALQLQPTVVLLDEPTASVDSTTAEKIERLVLHWHAENKERAFVWVSHDPSQVTRVSQRVLVLEAGKLIEDR